jgi:hypothetical protein
VDGASALVARARHHPPGAAQVDANSDRTSHDLRPSETVALPRKRATMSMPWLLLSATAIGQLGPRHDARRRDCCQLIGVMRLREARPHDLPASWHPALTDCTIALTSRDAV